MLDHAERDVAGQAPGREREPREVADRERRARVRAPARGERLEAPVEAERAVAWLRSGLTEGQTVIVYPPATTRDGSKVRVRTP